jgi:hypothetical protein
MYHPNRLRGLVSAVLLASLGTLVPSALVAADLSSSYEFKPVKIGGGGFVTGIQIHPSSGGPVYCRTDVGGVYRWNETTAAWTQLIVASALPPAVIAAEAVNTGDGLPGSGSHRKRLYHVESIAIDPSNPAVLFVAAGNVLDQAGTLLKSTNGGQSFQLMNLTAPMAGNSLYAARVHGERLAVHPSNSNTVLFGSRTQGLWRSVNGGLDWTQIAGVPVGGLVSGKPVGVGPVVFDAANPGRAYLSVATVGTFRSDDSGLSWSQIGTDWAQDLVISQGTVYICRAGLGVRRYTPSSGWLAVNPLGDTQVNNLGVDPTNSNRVFVMHSGTKKFYRTLNGGTSWTKLVTSSDLPGRELFRSGAIPWMENNDSRTWLSAGELTVDPNNPARLWFAEGMGVWRSIDAIDTNNSPSFDNISLGIEELVASDVLATPGGKVNFLAWDRIGFHRTHATLNTPPDLQIGLSQDFGMGISLATSGLNPNFVAATVSDIRMPTLNGGYDGFGVMSGSSTNGGTTWNLFGSVNQTTEANTPETLMFGEVVVSATNTNNLVWLPRLPNWFIRDGQVVPDGDGTANDQFIYSSTNGGASWQPASIGNYQDFRREYMAVKRSLAADTVTGGKFYAYDRLGRLFGSTDSGATWTVVNTGGLPSYCYTNVLRSAPARAGHLWFVTGWDFRGGVNSEGIYRSTTGGSTWTKLTAFTTTWHIGFGRALQTGGYPTIFVYGKYNGAWGLYRSTDEAATWDLLSTYPLGLLDHITTLNGDPDMFGRVYLGFAGNSFAYGTPTGTPPPAGETVIYSDVLSAGWSDWSFTPKADFNNISPTYASSSKSIKYIHDTTGWSTLSLRSATSIPVAATDKISGYVYSTGAPASLNVNIQTADSGGNSVTKNVALTPNTWTPVEVPFSQLGSPASIKRVNFAGAAGTVYYDQLKIAPATPPPPADTSDYHFETDTQGWSNLWANPVITSVAVSTDRAQAGTKSLKVTLNNTTAVMKYVNVIVSPPVGLTAGKTVTYRYWAPSGVGINSGSPFVQGTGVGWTDNWGTFVKGSWATVTLAVPANIGTIQNLGYQIVVEPGFSGVFYLDAIDWP